MICFSPLFSRCKEPGELSLGGKRPGAGQRCTARLCDVQLPSADRQVWPAAATAARNPCYQSAGRGVPLLQAPEWGRALQQPAY